MSVSGYARGWGLVLALAVSACHRDEEGPRRLARAEARWAELVEQRVRPQDRAFDEVVAELEAVPPDSRAWPQAQQRLALLRNARGPVPRRPLGRPDAGEEDGGHSHAEGEAGHGEAGHGEK